MRLRVLKTQLEEIYPDLEIIASQASSSNVGKTYNFENFKALQQAISHLDKLGILNEHLSQFKNHHFYSYSGGRLIIQENDYTFLQSILPELRGTVEYLVMALSNALNEMKPDTISIKIPPPKSFKDLEKTCNKLDLIFSQSIIGKSINGSVKISNFDTGSYWIEILVGSALAVKFIGELVKSAAVSYKTIQEGNYFKEKAQALKLEKTSLEDLEQKNKNKTEEVATAEAKYLYNTYFKNEDQDRIGRLKYVIIELANLLLNGAEIYPSLKAKEDTKEFFPDFKNLGAVEPSVIKLNPKKEK